MRGKFITLEGPDGSGKSTILNLLEKHFKEKNIDHIVTREPGGTKIGEDIRNIIISNDNQAMTPETEALLFAAARGQHVQELIKPRLNSGTHVIGDRFLLSSLAYQGLGRGLGIEEIRAINNFGIKGLEPDLILFFHIDPELTLARKTSNGGDRLEKEGNEYHNRVYNGYMKLIKEFPDNIKIIDARKSIEEVLEQSIIEINKILWEGA